MLLLVIAFIVVPLVELYVIIQVGGAIGIGPTVALLLIDSLLGAWLLRHQGRSAWVSFNRALAESRIPAKEVLDGVLIIFGGALLLTPGFITDIFGLALLIPPTRAIVRSFLKWLGISRLHWGPKAAYWGYGRVQKGRGGKAAPADGGAPPGGTAGASQAGPRPQAEDFSWESPGPKPGDIEGTAHEIRDDPDALPPGERAALRRMSFAATVCGFWDQASGSAGIGWSLGGSEGGVLLADGKLTAAGAELEVAQDGSASLRLGGDGGSVEAALRSGHPPAPLEAEAAPDAAAMPGQPHASVCEASVDFGGQSSSCPGHLTTWSEDPLAGAGILRHLALPAADGALLVALAWAPEGVGTHAEEIGSAWLLDSEGRAGAYPHAFLSTQYDDEGRQTRAGLELWSADAEAPPVRGAGTAAGAPPAASVPASPGALSGAILRSSVEGHEGLGSYLIWRG